MNGITRTRGVRGGRPCIEGTGIETAVVRDRFMAGDGVGALAIDYDLTVMQVDAAIRFEMCLACRCKACAWARKLKVTR